MNQNCEFQLSNESQAKCRQSCNMEGSTIPEAQGSREPCLTTQAAEDFTEYFAKEAEVNMDVPVGDIRTIPDIPDYTTPTLSPRPIVLRTQDDWYCLDGWEKIGAARLEGSRSIKCRVIFKADCTAEDKAFEKVAMRTRTQGGDASHAEKTAATARLAAIYTNNRPDMFTNPHGGIRIPGQHTADAEDNLVGTLSNGLGKRSKTIKKYLNHAEYLNADTLKELAEALVPKSFFEVIQKAKGRIVENLQAIEISNEEIATTISRAVRTILAGYLENNNKLDAKAIEDVVNGIIEPVTQPGQQEDPQPPDQVSSPDDQNTPRPEANSPEQLEGKKTELTTRLSDLASAATAINSDEGLKSLARNILKYGVQLCSELLPEDLESIIEESKAARRG